MTMSWRRIIAVASLLFLVEVLVFQSYLLTFIAALLFTIVGIARAVRQVESWSRALTWIALYWCVFVGAMGAIAINNSISRMRALKLGEAVRDYRRVRGQYPDRLSDLVPDFLPRIPR